MPPARVRGGPVNRYFQGATAGSSDEELPAAAPGHPVVRLTETR
ncbi:hypothetical protein [Streptomyces synnematoformans]|uniref:Uncharacterized protein n=1 Tax=Streptomyces synnematoformans TaxID=415721 RepID=A0ABP4KN07_9ACTN